MSADSQATEQPPVLAVDVDGVISLFGFEETPPPEIGRFHLVDGMPHFIAAGAGERLKRLAEQFELVWATGWEAKANEYLPSLLGLPTLPFLKFGPDARFGSSHWKLGPIARYAEGRPLAWIDDSLSEECYAWAEARARRDPTVLVATRSEIGIEDSHVETLLEWVGSGYTAS